MFTHCNKALHNLHNLVRPKSQHTTKIKFGETEYYIPTNALLYIIIY